jgi:hypothetical protein
LDLFINLNAPRVHSSWKKKEKEKKKKKKKKRNGRKCEVKVPGRRSMSCGGAHGPIYKIKCFQAKKLKHPCFGGKRG